MATGVEKLIQEIRSLSPEDQQRLRQALAAELSSETSTSAPPDERADREYQERLVKAGLLKQVKPRRRDPQAFDAFKPIDISGKPLSETLIEECR